MLALFYLLHNVDAAVPSAKEPEVLGGLTIPVEDVLKAATANYNIDLIDYEGVRFVSLRHVCDNLGLDPCGQFKKLRSNPKYTPMGICLRVPLAIGGWSCYALRPSGFRLGYR